MTRWFAAIVFLAAVMAAASAQASGSPSNELRTDPVPAKIETSAQNAKQPMTEQGGKY